MGEGKRGAVGGRVPSTTSSGVGAIAGGLEELQLRDRFEGRSREKDMRKPRVLSIQAGRISVSACRATVP